MRAQRDDSVDINMSYGVFHAKGRSSQAALGFFALLGDQLIRRP